MKCDELKIENACVYGPVAKVYLAEKADAAIAELKAENRNLKRAMWMARANYCHNFRIDWYIRRHPGTKMTQSTMENILIVAELKCRAKAEECK